MAKLNVRSTVVNRPMTVNTQNNDVKASQKEALDRILENICCIVRYVITITVIEIHNAMDAWGLEEQSYEYKTNHMKRLWSILSI